MFLPSGVQTGLSFTPGKEVSRDAVPKSSF